MRTTRLDSRANRNHTRSTTDNAASLGPRCVIRLWLSDKNPDKGNAPKKAECFTKKQAVNFASFIDEAVAKATGKMLGHIPVVQSTGKSLRPAAEDTVEWGAVRIIGGIRPQNFDVAYRPDGPRIAFDSKTLNDKKSVGKNWQNVVNDLATEASELLSPPATHP